MYAAAPILLVRFAVSDVSTNSAILLAPAGPAVLASAYFLLLLDAKKLHPFYAKVLIGGLASLWRLKR